MADPVPLPSFPQDAVQEAYEADPELRLVLSFRVAIREPIRGTGLAAAGPAVARGSERGSEGEAEGAGPRER